MWKPQTHRKLSFPSLHTFLLCTFYIHTMHTNLHLTRHEVNSQPERIWKRSIFVASHSNTVHRHTERVYIKVSSGGLKKKKPQGICLSAECHLVVRTAMTCFFQSHCWHSHREETDSQQFIISVACAQIHSILSIRIKKMNIPQAFSAASRNLASILFFY